jgi:hypothetical protein
LSETDRLLGDSDSVARSVYRIAETHFTSIDKDVLMLRDRFAAALVTNAMSAHETAEQNSAEDCGQPPSPSSTNSGGRPACSSAEHPSGRMTNYIVTLTFSLARNRTSNLPECPSTSLAT